MAEIKADYNYKSPVDTYRWLKAMMDKEGYKGSIAGYQPKGYHKVFTGQSADPNVTYWRPYSVIQENALAPMAVYRNDQEYQSYWEDPRNVGKWRDYLALQEDDFIDPPYIDRDFLENSYQLMKQQNGGSADWTSWKPLPFGHNLSYVAQQISSPDNAIDPNYLTFAENKYIPGTDKTNPAWAVQAFMDYQNVVTDYQAVEAGKKAEFSQETQDFLSWLQQNSTQQVIDTKYLLNGKELTDEQRTIFESYQKEMDEAALADYNKLEPWEKGVLSVTSIADMKNRPAWSTDVGILSRALMESLGGMGVGAAAGALVGTFILPGLGTAAGAWLGSVLTGAATGIASVDASFAERKGEITTPITRFMLRLANLAAEVTERTVGTAEILGADREGGYPGILNEQGLPEEVTPLTNESFLTAWKAADLQYESLAGTQNGGIGDWLVDAVSWLANKADPEKNSGLQTGLGEVWQLHKGLSGTRAIKGTGTLGRDSQAELFRMLSDKDNPIDPETALAIYRDKYGFSGNLNDMVYQTLLDPSVIMPRVMAQAGYDIAGVKVTKLQEAISTSGADPVLLGKLDDAIRWRNATGNALGNPIVDAMPYPVQMLFDLVSSARGGKGWRSTTPFWQSFSEYRTLKQSGLLSIPTNTFNFKQGDTDLGTVYVNPDNSFTWSKPDGSVEHMYSDVANALGYKFAMEDGQPVLYVHGQRASTVEGMPGETYTPPEGTTVVDIDPNATKAPIVQVTFEKQTVTVTADVQMPDGSRAENVTVNPTEQTFEVHGQDGITYIARAVDGIVIDTLDAQGVSIHDPNRTIKVNPVEIRVNGMTPRDVATAIDTIAVMGKEYTIPVQPDPKLAPRAPLGKGANMLQWMKYQWGEMTGYTRETQVRAVLTNFSDLVRNTLYVSGGSFLDAEKTIRLYLNGDIDKLTGAAQKIGSTAGIAAGKEIYKSAFTDPAIQAMVQIWRDPANLQRVAVIKKLSGIIGMTPEEFVKLPPAEIVSMITKVATKSGDPASLAMLGTITVDTIASTIKPYAGKDPLPVTDEGMKKKWLNAVETKVEKSAVEAYNVQPLTNIRRLLNLDKQILSLGVMLGGYLRTNIFSNEGTGGFMSGISVYRSQNGIDDFWNTLGMIKPSEGTTAFRVTTHGALFDTLNGGNTLFKKALKKASQKVSDISRLQPFLAASGWMEGKAHEGADATFAAQQMRRLQLADPAPTNKQDLINKLGQDVYQNFRDAVNQAMNESMLEEAYKLIDNTEVKLAQVQKAVVDSLYKDHPELGMELINTLGIEDSIRHIIKNAKTPQDVPNMIKQVSREVKEIPGVRAQIDAQAKLAEGAAKVRQEGILGLADVCTEIAVARTHTMLQESAYTAAYWKQAMEAGAVGYHGAIRAGLENQRKHWEYANAIQLNFLKGALSAMDITDPRQHGLFIAANDWFAVGTEWAEWRNKYWDNFHNDTHTDAEFEAAQGVVNLKSEEFRKREIEAIKKFSEEMAAVLSTSTGKTVAGVDINTTAGNAIQLFDFYINGDKNTKGYVTIAKETEDMYASTLGMPYKERKELENKHFKKVAIELDKLMAEMSKRAYNTWHRNNPAVAPAATSQKKPRAKHSDVDAKIANNNIQVNAAKAELNAQTISKGNVTRSALRDFLSMTDTDPDIAMALVDSVAGAWAFNNGKRQEEWYSNIGELAFVDADTFAARVFDKTIETAGMTTFDNAGKAVLTFAKSGNLTTLTHELGHVIESTLNPDQIGIVVENFGDGLTVGEYGDLSNRFKANMPLSPEELAKHNKVAEGFAEGYQKWLMDDAVRMDTPSKLAQIFKTISDWLHKLIGRLSERISSMDFPDALKDLYERVTRVVDTAAVEQTNSSMIATAPTGVTHTLIDADNVNYQVAVKVVDLRNIISSHNTDGTINTIFPPEFQPRTYNQLFVTDTAAKLNPMKLLDKNSGFATGAIVVNGRGVVLVGNHRAGAMRLTNMDHPDLWKGYQEELVKRLSDYGLSEKDLEGIEQPVLVYVAKDADAADIVRAGNVTEQQLYTTFDNAKRLAPSFDINTLTNMVVGENQSFNDAIRSSENKYIRNDFFAGLSPSEKTDYIDEKTSYINDNGISAIKNSLAYVAFGGTPAGDKFLQKAFSNADSISSGVLNALLEAVPYIVKLNGEITKGNLPETYSIANMLVKGVQDYTSFMSLPKGERSLDQLNIFDQPTTGKLDRDMIRFFQNYGHAPSVMSAIISNYVNSALATIKPPEMVSMFDMPAPEPSQLFQDILKKYTGQEAGALQAVAGNKSKQLLDTLGANSAASWEATVKEPIVKALREMRALITPTPAVMPDWINVVGLMSEDVKGSYRKTRAIIKAILDEIEKPDSFKPSETRSIILQQAFTTAITVDQPLRNYVGLSGNKDVINMQANKLFQDIEQMLDDPGYVTEKAVREALRVALSKENSARYAEINLNKTNASLPEITAAHEAYLAASEITRQARKDLSDYLKITKDLEKSKQFSHSAQASSVRISGGIKKTYVDKATEIAYEAKKLLAQGASEETIDKIIDAANEVIPVLDEQAAFAQLGGDPKRDVGIEKAVRVIEQPVRGTPMGKTEPASRPDGEMMTELELEIDTLLDAVGDEIKPRIGQDFAYPEGAKEALNKQLPKDKENLKEKAMAAAQIAQALRKEMLVDYATRYGADQMAEVLFPYQLWYTRSALLWLKKIATTPALGALIARYEEMLERNSMSGFPTRAGGEHVIPYGDNGAIYFDWLQLVYPPKQIFGFIQNSADLSDQLYNDTVSIITQKVKSGELDAAAAKEAITTRDNEVWNSAMAQATAAWDETSNNAVTMTSLAMLPRASFTNAYYYLINQQEKINPLTVTKLGNMLADVDPDGLIGLLGKVIALPENTVRKVGGLNRDGQWGEYYVDKKLSELAMSGAYSPDEVIRAMIDRSGAVYDDATRLAAADLLATSQPGGIVWHAIETRNLDGLMPAIMTALFPKGLYSEAEMEQRGLQKEYSTAWAAFGQGDTEAINKFFEDHPEYEARLAIFKEPEERLKEYMISGVWDAYGKLSTADKSLVADQLGKSFEVSFLDKQDYDNITIDTLTVWGKQLGAGVPASAEPTQQVDPLETYKPEVSAAAQEFVDYRTQNFPNWYTLQQAYYGTADEMNKTDMVNDIWDKFNDMSYNEQAALAQSFGDEFVTYFLNKDTRDYKQIEPLTLARWGRKLGIEMPTQAKILNDFPELRAYLDWKEQYLESNPVVAQWLEEKADAYDGSELTQYGNTTKEWMAQFDPVVGAALILYTYGEPLPEAARSELYKVWEASGKPNYTFDKWLKYGIGR